MNKFKILIVSISIALLSACQTVELTPKVLIDKLALIGAITGLKDNYVEAKEKITAESSVFTEDEKAILRSDVAAIETFYWNIKRITDAESAETVAIGLTSFTNEIDTIRLTVTNAATIVASNSDKFTPEAQSAFAVLIGQYNLVSGELDRQLAMGSNQDIADASLDLLRVAAPIILQVIAAAA